MSKSYSELLLDPRWQKKRLEVLSYYEFHCCECGDDKSTLHVHHTQYKRGNVPWEYDLSDLVSLCENCHKEHHTLDEGIKCCLSRMLINDKIKFADYALEILKR